jgi:hypothetical protein
MYQLREHLQMISDIMKLTQVVQHLSTPAQFISNNNQSLNGTSHQELQHCRLAPVQLPQCFNLQDLSSLLIRPPEHHHHHQ